MYRTLKISFLLAIAAISIIAVLYTPPIAQDLGYHDFFDQRRLYDINHFWNVVSNLPFLIVGLLGFNLLHRQKQRTYIIQNRVAYALFALGISLVAFGSAYYHLHPNNSNLLWDRLPMTLAFMAFFSIVISDYISLRFGKILLLPLIILAVASVVYWHYSETIKAGDLRFYALVQFLPMLLIALIVLLFNDESLHSGLIWIALIGYGLAKACEAYDYQIYQWLQVVSGHSVKHVVAALAAYVLIVRADRLAWQSRLANLTPITTSDRVI